MSVILSFFLSMGFMGLLYFRNRVEGRMVKLLSLVLVGVPLSLFLVTDYGRPSLGLLASLVILSLPKLTKLGKGRGIKLVCFACAGLVAFRAGFKIQFARLAFTEGYIYFTWLALPLTLGWLFSISRSVEIVHRRLENDGWKVFLVILFVVTVAFLTLVLVQGDGELRFGFLLGMALLGAYLGLFFTSVEDALKSHLARQLGFLLAALAVSGVVKSLTTFVLIAPVASLALPITSRSFALVRGMGKGKGDNTVVGRLGSFLGSEYLALLTIYTFLSYLGVGVAWAVRSPGPGSVMLLGSSFLLLPSLLFGARGMIGYLDDFHPRLYKRGRKVYILDTGFDVGGFDEALERIERFYQAPGTSHVATPDVTAVMRAPGERKLQMAYRSADLVTPDGCGLIWASDLMNLGLDERVAGIDLLEGLFSRADALSVYLLGSRPGVAAAAGEKIESQFPGVRIVGTENGYFDPSRCDEIIEEINTKSPDLLLVGMGVPLQERWIFENKEDLSTKMVMGVGGSLDVLSGRLPRAPRWMRENGLEWMFRIILEPARLWRARLIPAFMGKVYWGKLKTKLKNEIL